MADPFEGYSLELAQSDRDPKTKAKYRQIVASYRAWLFGRPPDTTSAKEYLAHLREQGYSPRSLLIYYHALRLFLGFLGQLFQLKLRKPHTLPPYHDRAEIERLISQAERGLYHQTARVRERNKALILVLAYTGLRKSELLDLRVGDIDLERLNLLVRQGKGQRDRIIPIAESIVLPLRQQCTGKSERQRAFEGLNPRSVYRVVTRLATACGLEGFHPHSLRHFFASGMKFRPGSPWRLLPRPLQIDRRSRQGVHDVEDHGRRGKRPYHWPTPGPEGTSLARVRGALLTAAPTALRGFRQYRPGPR